MSLIFHSELDRLEPWQDALRRHLPDLDIRLLDDPGDRDAVEFALVWKPPAGGLRGFPNLRCIFSLGAGVDHILIDPDLPPGVPVVRMIDHSLTQGMTEYVLLHVLRHHRLQPQMEACQRDGRWEFIVAPLAEERRVGLMGLGVLGQAAARPLVDLGFRVASWSRTPKSVPGVESFHGQDGLRAFLARTEILVCLLPSTPATAGILNAGLFAGLPRGASLINAGRGSHQVEEDILAALDGGQLSHATLDVFRKEPLPADHPFWIHPAVTVTPHNAALTGPESGARQVAEGIRRIRAGGRPDHIVDPSVGY
ncbi:MAG: 2-hydroxyacid dehydrogenase [Alphaproteobacteria bacterium]